MFKEFKPAFLFLGKFLGIYFVGNVLYGLFIESYDKAPDHITRWVTDQACWILNFNTPATEVLPDSLAPSVLLREGDHTVLSVYEGCNGVNIIIIFVAFLFAFGGPAKKMLWFLPLGILIIHVCNLLRLSLLYYVAQHHEHYFYFVHKYFFTAILYLVIFVLWAIWVVRFNVTYRESTGPSEPDNNR